ncbi:RecQ family ATP-dependent DNA helicase [Marinilabiliaceae bacterium JC017]|nr:RecQ family ATP-dependent DNA helicase [Marinilabiliaceae bacterium JC017]
MLHSSLKKYFGYNQFRPGQEEVVSKIVENQSAVAIFPTGSGKSLCYQLAAMHLPHLTVVVSPLLALISDQLDYMRSVNIPAARIDSTLSPNEIRQIQADIRQGKTKLLLISVERFKNERFRQFLAGVQISLLVVDEAHCISEWGHNFRPDYLKLPAYRQEFNIPQVLLMTATATPKVITDMCTAFDIPPTNAVVTGFYRANLSLMVRPTEQATKLQELAALLQTKKGQPTIIYVTLQKTAEEVAAYLTEQGVSACAYHAGMTNESREAVQNAFMGNQTNTIVATIAFGMGIDKANIRNVIHYDLPKSIENYSQEIGRAGRDGQPSHCILLGNLEGVNVLENFVYGDTPEKEGIKTVLEEIQKASEQWEVKMATLSNKSNIRQLPLKTLLVYLEMEGYIKPLYSYFGSYRFKNILSEEQIIGKFKGERQGFIKAIFDHSKKARLWTTVDFEEIRQHYGTDRKRIAAALDYFHEQAYIQLESKQLIDVYQAQLNNTNIEALTNLLYQRFKQKEEIEIDRIRQMIAFFESTQCLSHKLSAYFGEEMAGNQCGHCSVCLNGPATLPTANGIKPLSKNELDELLQPLKQALKTPPSADTMTRFLCGIISPFITKAKAKQMPGFGILAQHRYEEVKKVVVNNS